ncbi:MAG TPA: hypothetical protein VLJ39_07785, partial [Tepidisphaeraceae bacterium]|nr:hypothetical protein [Tepidisphaeraceae bacterium]
MAETNPQPDPNSIPPAANPDPSAAPVQPAKQPEPVKAKKRRRWPWVILVLFLLLLLLVAMVPTIVSSGIGRSIIVSQVNQRINGRLEMKDLSLGWTGGIRADGIVIYDSSNRQILQLPHFETGLTLLNAARGNYAIGKTEIDGLDVLVSREADGSLNWSHIAKSETTSKAPEPAKPETNKAPSKLPSVSGEVVVNNA